MLARCAVAVIGYPGAVDGDQDSQLVPLFRSTVFRRWVRIREWRLPHTYPSAGRERRGVYAQVVFGRLLDEGRSLLRNALP